MQLSKGKSHRSYPKLNFVELFEQNLRADMFNTAFFAWRQLPHSLQKSFVIQTAEINMISCAERRHFHFESLIDSRKIPVKDVL